MLKFNLFIGIFVFETNIESYLKENKNAIYLGRRIEEKIIFSILPAAFKFFTKLEE